MSPSRPAAILLASLLASSAIAARGQEAPDLAADDDDGRIVLSAKGHAEVAASGVTLEYIMRIPGEDGAQAAKNFEKKLKTLVKNMESEEAPVTTLVRVEAHWAPRFQANGFVFKPNFGQNPSFKCETGATFTGRFFVGIHDLSKVTPALARKRIAQVLEKLADNALTGAEDDTDIIAAHLEVDLDALKKASETDAMTRARKRATALARLANRGLGRATLLHVGSQVSNDYQQKWGSNYFNFVFPGNSNGWAADLVATCDTQLDVSFDLD